ncbi:MAG: hypothetical protein ACOX8W_08580 [bacterium]|jgi:hypothetical protein
MLRKKCRSPVEAEKMLKGIAEALRRVGDGIRWENEAPDENSFAFLGPVKPDFIRFLRAMTAIEDIGEIVETIGVRRFCPKEGTWLLEFTPVYKEAIRRKLKEWQEEIEQKQVILLRWHVDKPGRDYSAQAQAIV